MEQFLYKQGDFINAIRAELNKKLKFSVISERVASKLYMMLDAIDRGQSQRIINDFSVQAFNIHYAETGNNLAKNIGTIQHFD